MIPETWSNKKICLRFDAIYPAGFCPVKADILIIPENIQLKDDIGMPIGPDAIL